VTVNKLATLFAQAIVTASATVTPSITVTTPATSLGEDAYRYAHNYD